MRGVDGAVGTEGIGDDRGDTVSSGTRSLLNGEKRAMKRGNSCQSALSFRLLVRELLESRLALCGSGNVVFESVDEIGQVSEVDVALGDLDGDGDLDAFLGNLFGGDNHQRGDRVLLNDGDGLFTDTDQRLGEAVTFSVALGDLDGDGDLDAFVGTNTNRQTFVGPNTNRHDGISIRTEDEVWLNDGNGVFRDSGQRLIRRGDILVVLGDLDSDGDLDAFVTHLGYDKIWLNDGTGTFTDSGQEISWGASREIALGDMDGDGDLDAVIGKGSAEDSATEVWLNDGRARFTDSGLRLLPWQPSNDVLDVELGDIDGDDDLDILVTVENSWVSVWQNETPVHEFQPGNANRDKQFDQLDIVHVLQAGKYLTGEPADWTEGDWNCDGVFNQLDIVGALQTGNYLQGPYAARALDTVFAAIEG